MKNTQTQHSWENELRTEALKSMGSAAFEDPAHDLSHLERVVHMAKHLAQSEGANLEIVLPAAWLHDCVNIPKDDPRRKQASELAAQQALKILKQLQYPETHYPAIAHAIRAHSFSAGIPAETLEAKVVQDADRLDSLGAIGLARCFMVGGMLKRPLYHPTDPLAHSRKPDDHAFTLDHFFVKLFHVGQTLQTPSGQKAGAKRIETLKAYLRALEEEILLQNN